MTIKLVDGTELNPVSVGRTRKHVDGIGRDTLVFVFSAETSMDELDELFTTANCEKIVVIGDIGDEYIHYGYTVRAELKRDTQVTVCMGRRTYSEDQIASLMDTVDVLVMESLLGGSDNV